MKLFIGLALLSVAFATPMIQPVTLPEAPQPALEVAEGIQLPKPAMPIIESPEFVFPILEIADIRPAMIPQEVIDELRKLAVAPFDTLAFEDIVPLEVSQVIIVDHAEEVVPLEAVAEDVVVPVHFVEFAENVETPALEEAPVNADAVIVVDHLEFPSEDVEIAASPVNVVDVVEDMEAVPGDAVIVVDYAEELDAVAEKALDSEDAPVSEDRVFVIDNLEVVPIESEIVPDAVHFVNAPLDSAVPVDAVKVIDTPPQSFQYPPKIYDNPMLRNF